MLRLLALLGGAYALYRRFQGNRPTTTSDNRPTAGSAANRTANAGPKPTTRSASAGRKTKSDV